MHSNVLFFLSSTSLDKSIFRSDWREISQIKARVCFDGLVKIGVYIRKRKTNNFKKRKREILIMLLSWFSKKCPSIIGRIFGLFFKRKAFLLVGSLPLHQSETNEKKKTVRSSLRYTEFHYIDWQFDTLREGKGMRRIQSFLSFYWYTMWFMRKKRNSLSFCLLYVHDNLCLHTDILMTTSVIEFRRFGDDIPV